MALSCHTQPLRCHWLKGSIKTSIVTRYTRVKVCALASEPLYARKIDPLVTEEPVIKFLHQLWSDDSGQDIAEYAVMLAVILVIVVGTIRLIGSNANTVFSQVGSAIQ